MNIALLSCSKSKKSYKCPAGEMYSESANFRKTYEYAKLCSDKIYILSAKYGLLEEDTIIEPYELTLNNQKVAFRKEWAQKVLDSLRVKVDIETDNFIILTGVKYYEYLIDSLVHTQRPLFGQSMGKWIPTIQKLIDQCQKNDANRLHDLFTAMPRFDYRNIRDIPFKNGIYIMFDKDESFNEYERIVRVGTHTGQDNLKSRLRSHFANNQRSSIFRRNIGRVYLSRNKHEYLKIWNSKRDNDNYDKNYEISVENGITDYLRVHISFVVFQVMDKDLRLRLEDGIISTLYNDFKFKASNNWLGNNSPKTEIANSGLWCVNGLNAQPLTNLEFEAIKQCILGNESKLNIEPKPIIKKETKRKIAPKEISPSKNIITKTERIRQYIYSRIQEAKSLDKDYIDLVSGDIHKILGLSNAMPSVCQVMYTIKGYKQDILHTTPSGESSTITIRYYLK